MAFDLKTWKQQAAEKLKDAARLARSIATTDAPLVAYGALATCTLWPAVQAAPGDGLAVALTLGSQIGANLVSNIVQRKHDEAKAALYLAEEVAKDKTVRDELDRMLEQLQSAQHAQRGLSSEDRDWLLATLRQDAKRLRSRITIEVIKTGGGSVVKGRVKAGKDFVGRDKVTRRASHGGVIAEKGARVKVVNKFGESEADKQAEARQIYLTWLARDTDWAELRDVDANRSNPSADATTMRLSKIYTELDTQSSVKLTAAEKKALKDRHDRSPELEGINERDEERPLRALEAVAAHRRLVLLGEPGGGKSTFGRHVAHELAMRALAHEAPSPTFVRDWKDKTKCLPVIVILRDFDAWLPDPLSGKAEPKHVLDFIHHTLAQNNQSAAIASMNAALAKGTAFVLFDGLDEVDRREFVGAALTAFARGYPEGNRYLLTCRVASYPDDQPALQIPIFDQRFTLRRFDRAKVRQFVQAWYAELQRVGDVTATEAANKQAMLIKALDEREDLLDLAQNPHQLKLMTWVHTHKQLPDYRAQVYYETIQLALWQRERLKRVGPGAGAVVGDAIKLEALLHGIDNGRKVIVDKLAQAAFRALEIHKPEASTTAGTDADKLADVSESALERDLAELRKDGRGKPDKNWARDVLDEVCLRSGLLARRLGGNLTFPHRTIQEYLAGAHMLAERDMPAWVHALADDYARWREAVLLGVGKEKYVDNQPQYRIEALVKQLLRDAQHKPDDPIAWRKTLLAGEILVEINAAKWQDFEGDLIDATRQQLRRLIEENRLPALPRVNAGDALARIGDPRFFGEEQMHLPNDGALGFTHVPAGRFYMGTRPEDFERVMTLVKASKDDWKYFEREKNPQPETPTDAYYIARYPVTVAQFKQFVTETQTQLHNSDALQGLDTHPVRWVTWYEAMAYCDWLTERIKTSQVAIRIAETSEVGARIRNEGWRVMLPSEAEWERAARGDADMRVFTWADDVPHPDRANYHETGIGRRSPVGCFPGGVSLHGCLDMVGNLWEWTRSIYAPYPYDPSDLQRANVKADDNEPRVLRGGAFDNTPRGARVASRNYDHPNNVSVESGFRVVVRAHSSS
jgi:formylglycine-generating enzyme required for sulfatase activity